MRKTLIVVTVALTAGSLVACKKFWEHEPTAGAAQPAAAAQAANTAAAQQPTPPSAPAPTPTAK